MCNNLLFDGMMRRQCNGAKQYTDDSNFTRMGKVVGEHFDRAEGRPVRAAGAFRRDNVGMSNPLI